MLQEPEDLVGERAVKEIIRSCFRPDEVGRATFQIQGSGITLTLGEFAVDWRQRTGEPDHGSDAGLSRGVERRRKASPAWNGDDVALAVSVELHGPAIAHRENFLRGPL